MANQWYYTRDGEKNGPIGDGDVRKLAADGSLKPDDQIWKEGMSEWRKAGAMKGLFAEGKQAPPPIPPVSPQAPAIDPEGPSPQKARSVSFGEATKLAGQLTAKQAELTKIQQVSLSGPYEIIGKHTYETGTAKQEHQSLFQDIERLNFTVKELGKSSEGQPEPTTFTDKARALGGKAATAAKTKAAQLQLRQKLIELGKLIFESGRTPDACRSQKTDVEKLLARANELQSEIAEIKNTLSQQGGKSAERGRSLMTSTAVVASSAFFCAPIGLLLIWLHPTWEKTTKVKWATASLACFFALAILSTMQQAATPDNQAELAGDENTANQPTRKPRPLLHHFEPRLVAVETRTSDSLTPDFLPSGASMTLEYRHRLLKEDGATDVESQELVKGKTGNVMSVVRTRNGSVTKKEMWFSESQYSVRRGYVKNGSVQAWTLVIMIGACPGDSWTINNPGGDSQTYTLKSIATNDGVRNAFIVASTEGLTRRDSVDVKREIILREGVGLVDERGFTIINGKTRPSYATSLVKLNGAAFSPQ
jgi:hypothetical protein